MIATEPLPASFWDEVGWDGARDVHRRPAPHHLRAAHRRRPHRVRWPRRAVPLRQPRARRLRPRPGDVRRAPPRARVAVPRARRRRRSPTSGADRSASRATGTARSASSRRPGCAWAGGYVGDGVGTSNLAGRTLADLILGLDTELTALAVGRAPLAAVGAGAAAVARDQRGPAPHRRARPGGGADGQAVALARADLALGA